MPQMAPLMWMTLFLIFILIFMIFNILNYFHFLKFNKTPIADTPKSSMSQIYLNWKW